MKQSDIPALIGQLWAMARELRVRGNFILAAQRVGEPWSHMAHIDVRASDADRRLLKAIESFTREYSILEGYRLRFVPQVVRRILKPADIMDGWGRNEIPHAYKGAFCRLADRLNANFQAEKLRDANAHEGRDSFISPTARSNRQ